MKKQWKAAPISYIARLILLSVIFLSKTCNYEWYFAINLSLKRWKKKYEEEGRESLKESGTGKSATGRPKNENLDDLTYEELQVIVQIQRDMIKELELKKKLALAKKK